MSETGREFSTDWVGNSRTFVLAWGVPILAILAGSLVDVSARTAIWTVALVWMGTACLLNARRCGRTHCRFTGPFYILLTVPVLLQGFGLLPLGSYGWWILGAIILCGGKVIWWGTEASWGKYSARQ